MRSLRSHNWVRVTVLAGLALILLGSVESLEARQRGRGGRGDAPPPPPSAPTPYWSDGRVNLDAAPGEKGFWNVMRGSVFGRNGTSLETNLLFEEIPFQDWARDLYEYRQSRNGLDDPHARCFPAGGMRFFTVPNGLNIVDQPEMSRIFLISGENRDWRRVSPWSRAASILPRT